MGAARSREVLRLIRTRHYVWTEVPYKDLILVAENSVWYRNSTCELYYREDLLRFEHFVDEAVRLRFLDQRVCSHRRVLLAKTRAELHNFLPRQRSSHQFP
jgi:hypothetical protein